MTVHDALATLRAFAPASTARVEAEIARLERERDYLRGRGDANARRAQAAEAEVARLRDGLARMVYIAEHLFQMVPQNVWRDSGGDDGQGHYEGDYRAEGMREEIASYRALLSGEDGAAR